MRYQTLITGLLFWALAGHPLFAQNVGTGIEPTGAARGHQTGTRGANFLRISASARARALGDAGTALIEGPTAIFYNPSTAALAEGFEAAVTYTDLYAGLSHTFVGVILPMGDAGAFGAHAIVFSSGDIDATTELSPDGGDPLRGDVIRWNSVAIGLTYARRITDRLALGGTAKFVQEGIEFAHVNFFGFDLGTVFETGLFGTRLSASVTNLGAESRFEGPAVTGNIQRDNRIFNDRVLGEDLLFRYDTDKMELPTTFRFGLYVPMMGTAEAILGLPSPQHRVDVLTEINDGFDSDIETHFGVEYSYQRILFLRLGKHFRNENQRPGDWNDSMSIGGGVRLPIWGDRLIGLDYAYTNEGILDGVNSFGIQVSF